MIEQMPPGLGERVHNLSKDGELLVAVALDLLPDGRFGTEWLVVTDRFIRVFQAQDNSPRIELLLDKIKKATVDPLIGGGALIVTVDGTTVEVVRYTNACQQKMGRICAFLSKLEKYAAEQLGATAPQQPGPDSGPGRTEPAQEKPTIEPDPNERKRCPTCHLMLPEGTLVCPACLDKGKVLMRLIGYLKPYWRETMMVWFLMILGMVLGLVTPYLTRPLMDKVLVPAAGSIPLAERYTILAWLAAGLLAVQVAAQAVSILRSRILVKLGTRLSHDLRVQLYSRLQFLALRFFDKHPVGAMIARVTQDTQSLEGVIVDGMQHFVVNILTLVGIGVVLVWMNWKLTLLALLPVPLVIVLSHVFWKAIMSKWHRYWHYRARLTASVSDTLSGKRVVKAFAREPEEVGRFKKHSLELLESDVAAEQTWTTLFPILWFIMSLGSLLVWYFGGRSVLGGETTVGTLMAFLAYLGMFYGPLQFLSRVGDYLARSLTSAERVFEILDSDLEVKDDPNALPVGQIEGRVEFRDVTFAYDPHRPVLKHINLDIKPGEMIGLVGRSGAGKSTTVNLLCRLFDVSSGAILVDGRDIRQLKQRDLRSRIGVVLQDTFLFNGTIMENIGYAKPEATREEIMAAAKAANAHDFVIAKAEGYDTRVGERGQLLSGGERQRIAIARAILHNPQILVLDEATASVDTETEKQIQEAIARLIKGRTTFAIAHRLSTLRNAHRIVFLKEGEVAEVGTHAELLAKKGDFQRLVEMQTEISRVIAVGT